MIIPWIIVGAVLGALSIVWLVWVMNTKRERDTIDAYWWRTIAKRRWETGNQSMRFTYTVDSKEYGWKPNLTYDRVHPSANEAEIYFNPENESEASAVQRVSLLPSIIAFFVSGTISGFSFYFGFFSQSSQSVQQALLDRFPFALGSVFALIGFLLLFFKFRRTLTNRIKKQFFIESEATVIELLEESHQRDARGRQVKVFMPIFKYFVNDVPYRMMGYSSNRQIYTNTNLITVGSIRTIWINPDNPQDAFTDEPRGLGIMYIIMGFAFFAMGLLMVIFLR